MTNQEKFKEVFGLNISSMPILPNIPQIWKHRFLLLSKENYIDCVSEWLNGEYVVPIIEADKEEK